MSKLRIGWYCPFTLPPLQKFECLEAVQIVWAGNVGVNCKLGATNLCRKLSVVQKKSYDGAFDGILAADCCTLSRSVFNYIINNRLIPFIYEMHIPRKVDSSFESKLLNEWNKFIASANYLISQKSEGSLETSLVESERHKVALHFGNGWCEIPRTMTELLSINDNDPRETITCLSAQVKCPRHIASGISKGEETVVHDRECLIQSYISTMV